MRRYIFIDNYSGFIFGDETVDDAHPMLACQRMFEEISGDECTYEMVSRSEWPSQSGFYVYQAPLDFPQIDDGQNQDMIDAVCALGPIGFVAVKSKPVSLSDLVAAWED